MSVCCSYEFVSVRALYPDRLLGGRWFKEDPLINEEALDLLDRARLAFVKPHSEVLDPMQSEMKDPFGRVVCQPHSQQTTHTYPKIGND